MANTKLSPLAVPLALWCFGNCPMDSINLETSRSSRRRAPSWPGSWRGPRGSRRRARHPGLARPLQWLFCKISSIAAADSQEPRAPKNNPGRLCIPRSSAGGICAHLGGLARPWGSDPDWKHQSRLRVSFPCLTLAFRWERGYIHPTPPFTRAFKSFVCY